MKLRLSRETQVLILSVFIVIVVGFIIIWSLPTKKEDDESKVRVTIWNWQIHEEKYNRRIFDAFNQRHPDKEIVLTTQVSGMYNQLLSLALRTDTPPEIFKAPGGDLSVFNLVKNGYISSLNDIAPHEDSLRAFMAKFPSDFDCFLEGYNVFDDKVYGAPMFGREGFVGLFYNKKIFRQVGLVDESGEPTPPKTWSELREYAHIITQKGNGKYYGIVAGFKYPGTWDLVIGGLAIAGGYPFGTPRGFDFNTGRYVPKHPAIINAMELLLQIKADGSIFPGELSTEDEQVKQTFANDRAGMVFGGPWNVGNFLAYNPQCDFDVVQAPTPDDGIRRGYMGGTGISAGCPYVISGRIKHPQAVWEAFKFLYSNEYLEGYVKAGLGPSIFPGHNKDEYFRHPGNRKYYEWGRTAVRKVPLLSLAAQYVLEILEPVHPNLPAILEGIYLGQSNFAALDDLANRLNAALDRAIKRAQEEGYKVTRDDFIFPGFDPAKDYEPTGDKS